MLYHRYYPNRVVSELDEPKLRELSLVIGDAQRANLIQLGPQIKKFYPTWKIDVKGIELLNQMELNKSSLRLENLTLALLGTSLMLGSFGVLQLKPILPQITWLLGLLFAAFWIVGSFIIISVIFLLLKNFLNSLH